MNNRNLIPTNRLVVKTRARAIQRWSIVNAVYLGVLGAAAGALFAFTGQHDSVADASSVKAELSQSNRTLASLRQQSVLLKASLQSAKEISQTPDWSILLAALSNSLGDEVVLNRIDSTNDSKTTAPTIGVPKVLRLSGIGRSQQSVTQFVLKLEGLNCFSRVRLLQTSPQILRGYDSIGFELECSLTGKPEVQP
jgi:Tfp pilus assembly protein PilN